MMNNIETHSLDWKKMDGLIPAIIQHAENGQVLMLGYMNHDALIATITTGQLTLFSRSKQRLWRKGESSGNSMAVQSIGSDFDNDSLLIQVLPKESIRNTRYATSYQPTNYTTIAVLSDLIEQINEQAEDNNHTHYTKTLLSTGTSQCARKVGEEAIETIIAATTGNREEVVNESADLILHLLILLKACDLSFYDVLQCLHERKELVHT